MITHWAIKRDGINNAEINAWFNKKYKINSFTYKYPGDWLHYPKTEGIKRMNGKLKKGKYNVFDKIQPGYTPITFEQFKMITQEQNMEKTISYRLREDKKQYIKAIEEILKHAVYPEFMKFSNMYNSLKEAGVLDLWFEEVPTLVVNDIYKRSVDGSYWIITNIQGNIVTIFDGYNVYCIGSSVFSTDYELVDREEVIKNIKIIFPKDFFLYKKPEDEEWEYHIGCIKITRDFLFTLINIWNTADKEGIRFNIRIGQNFILYNELLKLLFHGYLLDKELVK